MNARQRRDRFRIEPGEEQCEVADVLADLAFAVERRGIEERLGLDEHFRNVLEPPALSVADLIEAVGVREAGKDTADVRDNIRIVEIRAREMTPHELLEQGP